MKDFKNLTVGICNDHAGVEVKNFIVKKLEEKGVTMRNFGTDSTDSCDYPDFAHPMAMAVEEGICDMGIAICGTGNGISMTCNKHQGIRAALSWEVEIARLAREHNNANVVGIPARFISRRMAVMMVREWLLTAFAGGRHQRRIDKITL